MVQSILLDTWEIFHYWYNHRHHHSNKHINNNNNPPFHVDSHISRSTSSSTSTKSGGDFVIQQQQHHHYHTQPQNVVGTVSSTPTATKTNTAAISTTTIGSTNYHAIRRRLVHHMIGYATLFGCYETIRRTITRAYLHDLSSSSFPYDNDTESYQIFKLKYYMMNQNHNYNDCTYYKYDTYYNTAWLPIGTAFVAGGFAGQITYVVNHYTIQFKRLKQQQQKCIQTGDTIYSFNLSKLSRPNVQTLGNAFLPMAFSFVAFQYAGEFVESLFDEKSKQRFLILVN